MPIPQLIFLAVPGFCGNVVSGLHGVRIGKLVRDHGGVPFVPQLSYDYDNLLELSDEQKIIAYERMVFACDLFVRFPGACSKCDALERLAISLDKPVQYTEDELLAYLDDGVEVA